MTHSFPTRRSSDLGLERTVSRVNELAKTGKDADFGKGDTLIDQEIGDPKHTPNPCFGALGKGPFYAVKIHPGDGSTTIGLRIDPQCRSEEHTSELQSLMRI